MYTRYTPKKKTCIAHKATKQQSARARVCVGDMIEMCNPSQYRNAPKDNRETTLSEIYLKPYEWVLSPIPSPRLTNLHLREIPSTLAIFPTSTHLSIKSIKGSILLSLSILNFLFKWNLKQKWEFHRRGMDLFSCLSALSIKLLSPQPLVKKKLPCTSSWKRVVVQWPLPTRLTEGSVPHLTAAVQRNSTNK